MSEPGSAQIHLTQKILWGALLASQAIYVIVVGSGVVPERTPTLPAVFPLLLAGVAAATAAGAHVFYRRASGAGLPLHADRPDPNQSFMSYLVAWVLDESVAIYGVVLGFLGFPATTWALFSAAAVALMLVHRPVSEEPS